MAAALESVKGARDGVIVPRRALRSGEDVFLDDYPLQKLREQLGVHVETALSGTELYALLHNWGRRRTSQEKGRLYTWQSNAAYTKMEENI